jgi:hypothetical protein
MIDEEHAVDMVDLMLQACRQQPLGVDLALLAGKVEIFDLHRGRPLDFLVIVRNRQAAFLEFGALLRLPKDFRIDEHLRLVIAFFF